MERELTLDKVIVSAVFHDSMDMGVVSTMAGTLWYVSWAEGTKHLPHQRPQEQGEQGEQGGLRPRRVPLCHMTEV